jgi:predicted dehydrogenase
MLARRDFLKQTMGQASLAVVGSIAAGAYASGADQPAIAAADRPRVRVAVMGLRNRGKDLVANFSSYPHVDIAYLCDVDRDVIAPSVKLLEKKGRPAPKIITDFRQALDDPEVNVLACAAPDHWHALATILACQAGKDVYVEKPCSHNPVEGRRMVEVARRTKRIVQVGTQRRTSVAIKKLVDFVRGGKLGKVGFARAWITGGRPSIGREQVTTPPSNLDFDLWCGPAPNKGYKKNLVPYHWHWRWDYGTGECGNNGVHGLDVLRWALGVEYPNRVVCGGGKYVFDDDQETPDTQLATFEYPGGAFQWEHRTWSQRGMDGLKGGLAIYGTEGNLLSDEQTWTVFSPKGKKEEVLHREEHTAYELPHVENFLDAIVTRQLPSADIEINYRSTLLCQLANIAWRTGSIVNFDGAKEEIVGNPAATALMRRESYRKGFELPTA